MPFVPVENVAEVEVRMSLDNQRCENTLYVLRDSPWDGAALTSLGGLIKTWWTSNYAGKVSTTVLLREIVCTDLTTATSGQVTVSGDDETGVDNGTPLSNNTTWAISFHTDQRGRSFRGRNYIVGLTDNALSTPNTLLTSFGTDMVNAYSELILDALTGGMTWVVVSRFSGIDPVTEKPIPRVAGIATPVTSVAYSDLIIDSQRRRLPGRGL